MAFREAMMGLESAEARAQAAFSRLEAALDGVVARERDSASRYRDAAETAETRRAAVTSANGEAMAKLDSAIQRLRGLLEG